MYARLEINSSGIYLYIYIYNIFLKVKSFSKMVEYYINRRLMWAYVTKGGLAVESFLHVAGSLHQGILLHVRED